MKKWILYTIFVGFFTSVGLGYSQGYQVSPNHPVYQLIKMHEKEMNSFSQNAHYSSYEKSFFSDTSFFYGDSEKQFLTQVAYMMDHGTNPNMRMNMSYIRMASINGKQYKVYYQYKSDGKNAVLVRHSDNQGKPMKAVYRFDLKKHSLEVHDYLGDQKKYQKVYEI